MASPIRMLLEYVGVEYNNLMYVTGPAPDYDKSGWFSIKYNLGLDFPNLPYWIDGRYHNIAFQKYFTLLVMIQVTSK